jgi:hypothetical protein
MEQSSIIMEIKDNTFARQFETTEQGLFQLNILFRKENIFDKINTQINSTMKNLFLSSCLK